MLKIIITSILFLCVRTINSQTIIESFDNSAGIFFLEPVPVDGSYLNFYNDTSHIEGNGSLKINYSVRANQSWGAILTDTYNPENLNIPYFNLSNGIILRFWYKVVSPIIMDEPGNFYFLFKLEEIDSLGNLDLWYHNFHIDLSSITDEWNKLEMELVMSSDPSTGFTLQFGDGDGELQLANIRGFQLVFVYALNNVSLLYPRAHGSILMDRLELLYPTSVQDESSFLLKEFKLEQNYPNPFNSATTIKFQMLLDAMVTLKIYDILGNEVTTLVNDYFTKGKYSVSFNASNLVSGMYLCRMQAGEFVDTKKILLLK